MPVTIARSPDRRVQRTRRALREALVALLVDRDWDELTVQDICDRADVGRSTFYTHFIDKDELLAAGLDELGQMLRAHRPPAGDGARDPLGFARGLIDHVSEQQRLFRALLGKRSGHLVQDRFRQMLLEVVRHGLAGAVGRDKLEPLVHYVAGALLELVTWWIDSNTPLAPGEVEALFRRLTAPALAAIR